jgi:hypothetical protein
MLCLVPEKALENNESRQILVSYSAIFYFFIFNKVERYKKSSKA